MKNNLILLVIICAFNILFGACTKTSGPNCSGKYTNVCVHSFKSNPIIGNFDGKITPDTIYPSIPKCLNLETNGYTSFKVNNGPRFVWSINSCEEDLPIF